MSDSTRERILSEGARLFASGGYHGVSMREVAQAVGVTKAALYHHYADKESLFLAIMEGALHELQTAVNGALSGPDFESQLRALARELISGAARYRPAMSLAAELRHVGAEKRADFERRYRAAFFGTLDGWMQAAAQRGELRAAPALSTRALIGLISPYVSAPAVPDASELSAALAELFLHGAAAPPRISGETEVEI